MSEIPKWPNVAMLSPEEALEVVTADWARKEIEGRRQTSKAWPVDAAGVTHVPADPYYVALSNVSGTVVYIPELTLGAYPTLPVVA